MDKFFPYTQIDIVQLPNGLGGDNIIENTFKGPIHQQLGDALQFIKNAIITQKVVKYPDKAEADRFFNYPYTAVNPIITQTMLMAELNLSRKQVQKAIKELQEMV